VLEQRARQLGICTRVSQQITSILDIDDLLNCLVELIRESFGYYYVAVFLVDNKTNELGFQAGSGEAGRQLRNSGLRLAIGPSSLNGEVAYANQALIVNDVSQDPRYLNIESLPQTRSELVIPLRVGGRVLGTLDVQSVQLNAFGVDDMQVMQSLGDQVAVAIENARLYDHSRVLAVMEERNRLARELHDSVVQSLYSLVLFAGVGQEVIAGRRLEPVRQHLARIEQNAQQALKEMRLLVYQLRPPTLDQDGLVGSLEQRLKGVEGRAGVKAELVIEGDVSLPPSVEESLYRIAQEALNNTLKHGQAGWIKVQIRCDKELATLEILDDGVGFDVTSEGAKKGMGLASMRERASELGGSLVIESTPQVGTSVKASVPLGANEASPQTAESDS
jgi:signal transduction histidine kinase